MKTLGFILLGLCGLAYVTALIVGMIALFPFGLVGLLALGGVGCLLIHIIAERVRNKEDDYYDKNVKQ
jgi:hypothetical protein